MAVLHPAAASLETTMNGDLFAATSLPPPLSPSTFLANGSGDGLDFLDTLAEDMDSWGLDLPLDLPLDVGNAGAPPPAEPPAQPPQQQSRALPSVPKSVFGQASPPLPTDTSDTTQARPSVSDQGMPPLPPSADARLAEELPEIRHASLVLPDYRPKIEPWERRSSEPNPCLHSLTGSPPSPEERGSPLGRPQHGSLQRTSLEASQSSRIRSAVDKTGGIQRRRSLRRGGSVRSHAHDTECRVADLSVQLDKAHADNAMLEGRNQLLEQFVGLQAKHTAPGGPPPPVHAEAWWLDAVTRQMVEQRLNLSGMLTFTLRGGRPINLTREQVAALSWLEFCKLWKDYMGALREGLAEVQTFMASHPGAECPAAKRLARLVYETGILRGCLQTASPNRHAALLCFLPDGEPRPPLPDANAWRAVANALGVTPHQRAQLVQLRVMYLRVLGRMASQRRDLVASLQASVPVADGGDVGAAGYEAALDAVEALRGVLRDEHSLLTQYKMIVWGRVFTPIQAAIATVQAYPWAADLPAIVNCTAEDMGEPSCAALLSGRA